MKTYTKQSGDCPRASSRRGCPRVAVLRRGLYHFKTKIGTAPAGFAREDSPLALLSRNGTAPASRPTARFAHEDSPSVLRDSPRFGVRWLATAFRSGQPLEEPWFRPPTQPRHLTPLRRRQAGSALVGALLIVIILGMGASTVWRHMHLTLDEGHRGEVIDRARYLAEAGLEQALAQLRANADYPGEKNTPLGWGRYSVAVERPGAPGEYTLRATGEYTNGSDVLAAQRLEARLVLDGAGHIQMYEWEEVRR